MDTTRADGWCAPRTRTSVRLPEPCRVAVPPHRVTSDDEVVTIFEWKCNKIPEGTQSAVLFKMTGDKVSEERWFVDTVQWQAAF